MNSWQQTTIDISRPRWTRGQDGILAGVCSGIAAQTGTGPWFIRLLWLLAVLAAGTGIIAYIILALTLPREDQIAAVQEKKFLGVCLRIARHTDIEVGLVRAAALFLALLSAGATVVGYLVLYFVMPEWPRRDLPGPGQVQGPVSRGQFGHR